MRYKKSGGPAEVRRDAPAGERESYQRTGSEQRRDSESKVLLRGGNTLRPPLNPNSPPMKHQRHLKATFAN